MQSIFEHGDPEIAEIDLEYVGFWPRFGAYIIDTIFIFCVTAPLLTLIYGGEYWSSDGLFQGFADLFINLVFPGIVVIVFWVKVQATPGKMAIHSKIVDAETGRVASTGQYIGRYFAYIISALPLFFGYLWIAFDDRKQGWHDKLAGTVVVRPRGSTQPKPVSFDKG